MNQSHYDLIDQIINDEYERGYYEGQKSMRDATKALPEKIVHVGDEIYSELTDSKAVVHRIDTWHRYQCLNEEGAQFILDPCTFNTYWVKTGNNYPQIGEVLKQLKGDI